MKNNLSNFIEALQTYSSSEDVFNPWRDYDELYDISPDAPAIRLKQAEQFLESRVPNAKYLLIAEAVGYQGARFTGVPLISERILLGNHKSIKPGEILKNICGMRTSNPNNNQLKSSQKLLGFTEPTATIIWKEILESNVSPFEVMTWNMFPFHPFDLCKGPLSNRTPTTAELEVGIIYSEMLLKLCPKATVIAIGGHSGRTLTNFGIKNIHVPHPANGGAVRFRNAIRNLLI